DHLEGHVERGELLAEGERRSERGARDEVVAAAVADLRQRVVLHAQRGDQAAGAGGGAEGGGQLGDAALERESGLLQQVRAAVMGAVLVEGGLGIRVQRPGQGAHRRAVGGVGGGEGGQGGIVGGHGEILPRPSAACSVAGAQQGRHQRVALAGPVQARGAAAGGGGVPVQL